MTIPQQLRRLAAAMRRGARLRPHNRGNLLTTRDAGPRERAVALVSTRSRLPARSALKETACPTTRDLRRQVRSPAPGTAVIDTSCALGAAYEGTFGTPSAAVAEGDSIYVKLEARYPVLEELVIDHGNLEAAIIHRNDTAGWSRARIASWLERLARRHSPLTKGR